MKNKRIIVPASAPTVLHIGDFPQAKHTDIKAFLWDKAQFVLVSVSVFVLSYFALNYQAIYQNIDYKLKIARGTEVPKAALLFAEDSAVKKIPVSEPKTVREPSHGTVQETASSGNVVIPKITLPVYPPDTRIFIPRIFKNIPVIGIGNSNLIARDWEALEDEIQDALRSGVVHYPGTSLPGEPGNVVVTGHSSFYAWDPGRFKDVFGLLHQVQPKDKIFIFHNQKKYEYEIFDIRVVKPSEIDVLGQTNDERLTLITCTPLGTNLKRLVITAKRV